jgi:WD40 repeat protein
MVSVWDWQLGKTIRTLNQTSVTAMALTQDGKLLATGGDDLIRIWDTKTFKPVAELSHEGSVRALAFSWDGTRLASAASDHFVRVWSVATWLEADRIRVPTVALSLGFRRDDKQLFVPCDGIISCEDVRSEDLIQRACSLLTRGLSSSKWKTYMGNSKRVPSCSNVPLE